MLLSFRVANYRSFRDEVTFSTLATRLDKGVGRAVTVAADGSTVDVLPVVAIMGANASGKSNLLRAMNYMREAVLLSAQRAPFEAIRRDSFRLDRSYHDRPMLFEVEFSLEGSRYQYGFEIGKNEFTGEWLLTYPHKRAQTLFDRDNGEYQFGKRLGGQHRVITEITRPNVLFLSAAAQAGHPLLSKIYEYFLHNLVLLDVPERGRVARPLIDRLQQRHRRAVQLLALADLGITDARVEKDEPDPLNRVALRRAFENSVPPGLPEGDRDVLLDQLISDFTPEEEEIVKLVHRASRGGVSLPFDEESLGTKSWLAFVAYALDALESGATLLVDELDASLHPLLITEALRLFQESKLNHRGGQLIFTTHDTTMLGNTASTRPLSRGQCWFTEKAEDGSSTLVPLSDFRPRKNEDLERGYLQGRYGGTPRVVSVTPSELGALERGRDG